MSAVGSDTTYRSCPYETMRSWGWIRLNKIPEDLGEEVGVWVAKDDPRGRTHVHTRKNRVDFVTVYEPAVKGGPRERPLQTLMVLEKLS